MHHTQRRASTCEPVGRVTRHSGHPLGDGQHVIQPPPTIERDITTRLEHRHRTARYIPRQRFHIQIITNEQSVEPNLPPDLLLNHTL